MNKYQLESLLDYCKGVAYDPELGLIVVSNGVGASYWVYSNEHIVPADRSTYHNEKQKDIDYDAECLLEVWKGELSDD